MSIGGIVVLGAGGFAREVVNLIEDINRDEIRWKVMGYADKNGSSVGQAAGAHGVVFSEDDLLEADIAIAVGIGDPRVLRILEGKFGPIADRRKPNLIHPSVLWNPARTAFGLGNVICAGNVFTVDIEFGSFNILNLSCTVGHDVAVGDCCVINPGCNISGGVTIGSRTLIGTGARILQGLTIGAEAQIGAGAVVVKDVPPGETVVGVPARPLDQE